MHGSSRPGSSHNQLPKSCFRSLRTPMLPAGLPQAKQQSAKRLAAPLGPTIARGAAALHNA